MQICVLQGRAPLEEDLIARAIAAALGAAHGVPYVEEGTPHPDAAAEGTPGSLAAAEASARVEDIAPGAAATVRSDQYLPEYPDARLPSYVCCVAPWQYCLIDSGVSGQGTLNSRFAL